MEQYVIKGGNPLVGEVEIGGAKNAALAILSAEMCIRDSHESGRIPGCREERDGVRAFTEPLTQLQGYEELEQAVQKLSLIHISRKQRNSSKQKVTEHLPLRAFKYT